MDLLHCPGYGSLPARGAFCRWHLLFAVNLLLWELRNGSCGLYGIGSRRLASGRVFTVGNDSITAWLAISSGDKLLKDVWNGRKLYACILAYLKIQGYQTVYVMCSEPTP